MVSNICVYASPDRTKPVAIVVPAEPALREIARENGIDGSELEDLTQDMKVQTIALHSMQQVGRKSGLASIEILDGVVLVNELWTPENVNSSLFSLFFFKIFFPNRANFIPFQGLTTAAGKLNRRALLEKYGAEIERAYARNS